MIYNWVLGFNNILQMVNHSQIEQEYAENFSKYLLEPKMLCFNFHIFFIYDLISSYIIYRVDMASTMLYLHNLFSHASRGCLPLPVNLFAAYILPVAGCAKEGPWRGLLWVYQKPTLPTGNPLNPLLGESIGNMVSYFLGHSLGKSKFGRLKILNHSDTYPLVN